jgi:hypothetical protein
MAVEPNTTRTTLSHYMKRPRYMEVSRSSQPGGSWRWPPPRGTRDLTLYLRFYLTDMTDTIENFVLPLVRI